MGIRSVGRDEASEQWVAFGVVGVTEYTTACIMHFLDIHMGKAGWTYRTVSALRTLGIFVRRVGGRR